MEHHKVLCVRKAKGSFHQWDIRWPCQTQRQKLVPRFLHASQCYSECYCDAQFSDFQFFNSSADLQKQDQSFLHFCFKPLPPSHEEGRIVKGTIKYIHQINWFSGLGMNKIYFILAKKFSNQRKNLNDFCRLQFSFCTITVAVKNQGRGSICINNIHNK